MSFDQKKIETFPGLPGVYVMKSKSAQVIYVGKAKNIKARVKQYFAPGGDGRQMVPFLVNAVESIETIVLFSEKEALLLENNLIKQYRPKYNALLKDDKSYIALKLTSKNTWPQLQLVRYKGKPAADGTYFGPYTSAGAARRTLDLLQKLFPLRQCSDQEFVRRTRPCLLWGMKRCCAPCVQKCTKEEYDSHVSHVVKFLRGQDREVLKDMYQTMEKQAEDLEFEKAAETLRMIRQIEQTIEGQLVDKVAGNDSDVFGIYRKAEEVILSQLLFRGGKLVGSRNFNFSNIAEEDGELLESFLLQHYEGQKGKELPHEILLPVDLPNSGILEEVLSENSSRMVAIVAPRRGDKRRLVHLAIMNAQATFTKEKDESALREKILLELQEKLRLKNYPRRIECFDNSNMQGDEPVAAMIAFTEGLMDKKRYRMYKIKSVEGPDDYQSMREVLTRRYTRAKEENNLPDLIIVDGGKGHLNIALQVIEDLNLVGVDAIGIAKEQGRHDKGMSEEQVFLPGLKDPVKLMATSKVLLFLQQVRDEAHRFAIAFHQKRRSKKMVVSALDSIEGIGAIKRAALLRHFGSVKRIKMASDEELKQVKGINKRDVENIIRWKASE